MLTAGVHANAAFEGLEHSTVGNTLDLCILVLPGIGVDAAGQVDAAIQRALKAGK
jgi:hypothetical protein